jgi:hypothetical protein
VTSPVSARLLEPGVPPLPGLPELFRFAPLWQKLFAHLASWTADRGDCYTDATPVAPARPACEGAEEKRIWNSRITSASLNRRKQEHGGPEIRRIGLGGEKQKLAPLNSQGDAGCTRLSVHTICCWNILRAVLYSGVLRSQRCGAHKHNSTPFRFLAFEFPLPSAC